MSSLIAVQHETTLATRDLPSYAANGCARLYDAFDVDFSVIDGQTGELTHRAPGQPLTDAGGWQPLCGVVLKRGAPAIVAYEEPLAILAIPMLEERPWVAVALFLTRPLRLGDDLSEVISRWGLSLTPLASWAKAQTCWPAHALERLAATLIAQAKASDYAARMEQENQGLAHHLAASYEEITLLHRLTQNLKLSQRDEDLARTTLEWLEEVIPAELLAIELLPVAAEGSSASHTLRTKPQLLTVGETTISRERILKLTEYLRDEVSRRPVVLNRPSVVRADWPFPEVRELTMVTLAEGRNLFGWALAINHRHGSEFSTEEATLMSSVGAILGIHSGNAELYRQQAELMAGVVRALTSAIDAKDPYTCGHSDRVARIAVRLAEELHVDPKALDRVYLAGLLHDIGKIGVNDAVLRKAGQLTAEEYEHVQAHPSIGHRILGDLKRLEDVVPIVLHHHEAWDGSGYPGRLKGEEIPLLARIISVADAYDAMGSDRPYRLGLPDEKIEAILRAGAGKQWDPQVVAAFFAAVDDLRRLVHRGAE